MGKGTPKKTGLTGFTGFESPGNPVNPVNPVEKNSWPRVRLGDVCEINIGRTPPRGVPECWTRTDGEGMVWLSIADLLNTVNGEVISSKERITKTALEVFSVPVVKKGTFLLSFKLTLGRCAVAGCDLCTNEAIAALPFKDDYAESVDLLYLCKYCEWFDWNAFAEKDEKVLGKTLNKKKLAEVPIMLPPLSVQHEIVARLERELGAVDKLAKKFEELESAAEAEFKAELKETFEEIKHRGTETQRLGDVFRFIDYRGKTPTKISSGVPLITARNIRRGYLDYSERFYISKEEYETRQTRGIAKKGDLLFTTEAPMGFVAVADLDEFSTGQRIITFQWPVESEAHENRYFLYYFMSDLFQRQLEENASGATAQGIKASRLVNLRVVVPVINVQREVVARLDAAKAKKEKLVAAARRGRETAALMHKAILKEAFE